MISGKLRDEIDTNWEKDCIEAANIDGIKYWVLTEDSFNKYGVSRVFTADNTFIVNGNNVTNDDIANIHKNNYEKLLDISTKSFDEISNNEEIKLNIVVKNLYTSERLTTTYDRGCSRIYVGTKLSNKDKRSQVAIMDSNFGNIKELEIGNLIGYKSESIDNERYKNVSAYGFIVIENIIDISDLTIEPELPHIINTKVDIYELVDIEYI